MKRYYYLKDIKEFIDENNDSIKDALVNELSGGTDRFSLIPNQNDAWKKQIEILKKALYGYNGKICFEYSVPRRCRRIDNVILINNHLIIIEFKVGEKEFKNIDKKQLIGYAKDLIDFHDESKQINIYTILCATNASKNNQIKIEKSQNFNNLIYPILTNEKTIRNAIECILNDKIAEKVENSWFEAGYNPTPSILEAAHAIYLQNNIKDFTKHGANDTDIAAVTDEIKNIIEDVKRKKEKSIIFVTGVPGSGKTLIGLKLIQYAKSNELYSYLSGNRPLVKVLQKELENDIKEKNKSKEKNEDILNKLLINDDVINLNDLDDVLYRAKSNRENNIRKRTVKNGIEVMIDELHHFRDEQIIDNSCLSEHVIIIDEAQRCWSAAKLDKKKKGLYNGISEADALLQYMNRWGNDEWCCIVALIGGGQEIHDGEKGLKEWFDCLNEKYKNWRIYYSDNVIFNKEYLGEKFQIRDNSYCNDKLHLKVSMRAYKSKYLSDFVDNLINNKIAEARINYKNLTDERYKLYITRDIEKAKKWLKETSEDCDRYGIIASSNAKRLRNDGIFLLDNDTANITSWFLNDETDIRSSYQLEIAATEFQIQGLEIDYAVIAWDYDYYIDKNDITKFSYKNFKGCKWQKVKDSKDDQQDYIKNTYRVLLTRARQGMIIYVPKGIKNDITKTRLPEFFDLTYNYLKSVGIKEI